MQFGTAQLLAWMTIAGFLVALAGTDPIRWIVILLLCVEVGLFSIGVSSKKRLVKWGCVLGMLLLAPFFFAGLLSMQ